MADLDTSAAQALEAAQDLLVGSEEARARFAAVRERVLRSSERLEAEWTRLLARGRALLEQVESDEKELAAARGPAEEALDHLQAGLAELETDALRETDLTRGEFEGLTARVEEAVPELSAALEAAEEAERALQARLVEGEAELTGALAEAEEELRVAATAELKAFEAEVERTTAELHGFLSGECLPALADRSQELFDQLVHAEEEVRAALETAAEGTEAATDDALRACNDGYEESLGELDRVTDDLDHLLEDLEAFVRDGIGDLQQRKDRWDDDLEELLSRFSFVRL